MKRNAKLFGIAALVAAMVLVMVACDTGTSPGGNSGGDPTVSAVTVAPASATVVKGGSQQFTASVAGTGSPAQTVTWSIATSGIDAGTKIVNGLLTVAAAETKTSLTVRATSTVDTSKYGEAVVTVSGGGSGTPTVSAVTITPASATVAKGGTQQFTANVAGTNSPAQTVIWSIESLKVNGTGIDNSGMLTVASDETEERLLIRATSTVDTSKYGEILINVWGSVPVPTVTGVTVSPATATVLKGNTQQFTATVTGTNNPAQTVTWSLYGLGSLHADTTIDETGKLTVSPDEENSFSFYVIATSTVDTSKSGSAMVSTTPTRINGKLPPNLENTSWKWVSGGTSFGTNGSITFASTSMRAAGMTGTITGANMSIHYSYENGEIKPYSTDAICTSYVISENGTTLELVGGKFSSTKWVKTN